ncbi:MAG TPA: sugar transferase [Micromonosporaceae bacterium]|nr:sugar transferase [Micromonosporaceae bacterium]
MERFTGAEGSGSDDDTMPSLFTTDELGARFGLPAAPVSPAPAGTRGRAPGVRPSPRPKSRPRGDSGARCAGRIYYTAAFHSAGARKVGSAPGPREADPGTDRPFLAATPTDTFDPAVPRRPSATSRHASGTDRRARWQARYTYALLASDLLAALVGGAVAFVTRFHAVVTPYNRPYALVTGLLPTAFLLALVLSRAYEARHLYVGSEEYQRVMRAGLALTAMTAIVSYAVDAEFARGYVIIALPLATAVCLVGRFVLRKRLHRRRERGECLRRVIVVGHERSVVAMFGQLSRELYHGLEVVGCCLPPHHRGDVGMPVYGTFDDVAVAVRVADADTVIVLSCPELDGQRLRRLAWRLERGDVDLIVASSLMDVAGARTTIRPVDGLPMLHVDHPRLSGASRVGKAVFDRVAAAAGLVLLSPLLLAICVAVRHDSPGPVLFRQVRVGKGGRPFVIFKFRTMVDGAEARREELSERNDNDGVLFKMRDDPRITRVGRILRRFSLDELPQLVNVLRGDMSLVGPRPPLPEEVAAYPADMRRRLAVSPGLTGLWQVSGRSDLSWEEAVRLDLRYVENWSFSLDCVILLRTLSAVCRSSGAY